MRDAPSPVLICDIDGVIADSTERMLLAGPEPSRTRKLEYKQWLMKLMTKDGLLADEPIVPVIEMVRALDRAGWQIVFLTSRSERWRETTKEWLREFVGLDYAPLLMRPEKDWRSSADFKLEAIDNAMDKWAAVYPNEYVEEWFVVWDDDPEELLGPALLEAGIQFMKPGSTVTVAQQGVAWEEDT